MVNSITICKNCSNSVIGIIAIGYLKNQLPPEIIGQVIACLKKNFTACQRSIFSTVSFDDIN